MPPTLYLPAGPLRDFVACFWHWDGYPAPAPRERALPAGTLDLIINLTEDRFRLYAADETTPLDPLPGSMITGAHAGYITLGTSPGITVMGVHFKPGGAFPFFSEPSGDLEDTHGPLEAFWGSGARALRERLIEAPTPAARFLLLERFLLQRAVRPLEQHTAVAEALRAFEDPRLERVAQVNERTGLSPRRLIALFRERVGQSPKSFWRVRRFQAALRQLEQSKSAAVRGTAASSAAIAVELGYCDQAHFNRDFRAFTGMSPRRYLAEELQRPNHVPLRGSEAVISTT